MLYASTAMFPTRFSYFILGLVTSVEKTDICSIHVLCSLKYDLISLSHHTQRDDWKIIVTHFCLKKTDMTGREMR